MTWFKVDDSFPDHDDVMELLESKVGFAAVGIWTLGGAWSSKHLKDGFVSARFLKRLGAPKSALKGLCDVGLWTEVDGGYQFRNWAKYQPSKVSVETEREKARERMRRKRSGERSGEQDGCSGEQVKRTSPTRSEARPVPSRPVLPDQERDARAPGFDSTAQMLERMHEARHLELRAVPPAKGASYRKQLAAVAAWVDETAASRGREPRDVAEQLLAGFFASDNERVRGDWGMRFLEADPTEFFAPAPKPKASPRNTNQIPGVVTTDEGVREYYRQLRREYGVADA